MIYIFQEALTKSDSSLIQKYVGLYHQIRMLKEEVECYNHEVRTAVSSATATPTAGLVSPN